MINVIHSTLYIFFFRQHSRYSRYLYVHLYKEKIGSISLFFSTLHLILSSKTNICSILCFFLNLFFDDLVVLSPFLFYLFFIIFVTVLIGVYIQFIVYFSRHTSTTFKEGKKKQSNHRLLGQFSSGFGLK